MDFIKKWTVTVSTTLIIATIFSILAPKGNMGNFFKVILSIFIFGAFIIPVINTDVNITFPEFDNNVITDKQQESYENIIENNILTSLESAGYNQSKVKSKIEYSDNEITVKELSVVIQDDYDKNEVKKYIRDKTGFNPEVYYFGE